MPYPINDPTYPVVERDPTFNQVMTSFRSTDYRNLALATGISLPFGYVAGQPVLMRSTMVVAGTIGLTYGLFLGFSSSFARLTGYRENTLEVAKHGSKELTRSTT